MKTRLFSLFLLLTFILPAWTRDKNISLLKSNSPSIIINNRPRRSFKKHEIGNMSMTATNYGSYGDSDDGFTMEWPLGSNAKYLWGGWLWIGAEIDGERLVSSNSGRVNEFSPAQDYGFFFGPEKSEQDHLVVYNDTESVRGHSPMGVQVRERGLTWSIAGFDETIILEYEIENIGDSKLENVFVGWMFDCDIAQTISEEENTFFLDDLVDYDGFDANDTNTDLVDWVDPLDIDSDGETGYDEWGWPYGYPLIKDGNVTNPNYSTAYIESDGFYDEWTVILDENGPDLYWQTDTNPAHAPAGTVAKLDDQVLHGWLVPRNTSYMFDADYSQSATVDLGERYDAQPTPGFVGGRLIYSDIIKDEQAFPYLDTIDDTYLRPYAHMWWNWENDAWNDGLAYAYLTAQHPGATRLGKHYKFLPSPFDLGGPAFDYRWLTSTGPFTTLNPGETIRAVYAVGIGRGLQGLRANMDNALKAYYSGSQTSNPYKPSAPNEDYHYFLSAPPLAPVLEYTPLDGGVRLVWDNAAETTPDPIIGQPDFQGYKIYRSAYDLNSWELVAAFDNVNEPVYLRNSDGKIINPKNDQKTGKLVPFGDPGWEGIDESEFVLVDLPDVRNHYDDYGGEFLGKSVGQPINGLAYFYTVVAYDYDKPETKYSPELLSQESPKDNYMIQEKTGYPLPVVPVKMYGYEELDQYDLNNIKVVPNPYRGSALYESKYEDRIEFTNLPPTCKITIFTLVGDMIDTIYHTDGTDAESWDMVSRNRQRIKSGLYVYTVEVNEDDYKKFMGKFVILR